MKKSSKVQFGGYYALVPETDEDRQELSDSLEDDGVRNSLSFSYDGQMWVLLLPDEPQWDEDGAMLASVKLQGEDIKHDVWFWVIDLEDGPGRRFAYWGFDKGHRKATTWRK